MITHSSTELAVIAPATATPKVSKVKRFAQMAGSAVLSAGLVTTFALPAYATSPEADGTPDGAPASQAQALTTADIESSIASLEAPSVELDGDAIEAARLAEAEAEAEAAAEAEAETQGQEAEAPKPAADIPAGAGAEGLANAARAQLGVGQDCTDMVQNALAAIGMTERRDQGGYDHGVSDFFRYGTTVNSGSYAVGDILIWPGNPHVAIYIGNGQAVHGGWSGNNTMIASATAPGVPQVVRLG